jgi:hypothetical protein
VLSAFSVGGSSLIWMLLWLFTFAHSVCPFILVALQLEMHFPASCFQHFLFGFYLTLDTLCWAMESALSIPFLGNPVISVISTARNAHFSLVLSAFSVWLVFILGAPTVGSLWHPSRSHSHHHM